MTLSWLTRHGVFYNTFLFYSISRTGGKKPFSFLFSAIYVAWTECYGMHASGIFGQFGCFCASGSMLLQELSSFLFFFWTGHRVKKWKGRKGKAFFVCATKGVFPFFHLIIFSCQVFIGKARREEQLFTVFIFHPPPFAPLSLSRALSLSLSLSSHLVPP